MSMSELALERRVSDLKEDGKRLFQARRPDAALGKYNDALILLGDAPPSKTKSLIQLNAAVCLVQLKRFAEAEPLCRELTESEDKNDATFFKACYNLGAVCAEDGRLSEALGYFRQSLGDTAAATTTEQKIKELEARLRLGFSSSSSNRSGLAGASAGAGAGAGPRGNNNEVDNPDDDDTAAAEGGSDDPLQQRYDYGRLVKSGEASMQVGHAWFLVPRDWFSEWSAYTGYDSTDQAAWSTLVREVGIESDALSLGPANPTVQKIFGEKGVLLPGAAVQDNMRSPPGVIETGSLLAEPGTRSSGLVGARLRPSLDEADYELVPAEAHRLLVSRYGRKGPPIRRFVVQCGDLAKPELLVDLYPELKRYDDFAILGAQAVLASEGGAAGKSSQAPLVGFCDYCGNDGKSLLRCSACKLQRYCDTTCQKQAWPEHKKNCAAVKVHGVSAGSGGLGSKPDDQLMNPAKVNGKVGLVNLGNTCFMNSSLQSLSAVWPLTEYFLSGRYKADINEKNVLGTKGRLVKAYGGLIDDLWSSSGRAVAIPPSEVKRAVSSFTDRDIFRGYQQHDAQELLNFLIDGLHEDLNLIQQKPAVVDEESDGTRPDNEVAQLSWTKYLMRNRSTVVDLVAGLFKNTIECRKPGCSTVSIKYDPFHLWTVPITNSASAGSQRYITVYLQRLLYDPEDARTWEPLSGAGDNADSGSEAFWSRPRSAEADFRGGPEAPRIQRFLLQVDRKGATTSDVREQLEAKSGVPGNRLVFIEVNQQFMMSDVYVDDKLLKKIPDHFAAARSEVFLHAFEVAPPDWRQPGLLAETREPVPVDSQADVSVAAADNDAEKATRLPGARVLVLTEIKSLGQFESYSSLREDQVSPERVSWEQAFEGCQSLGPLVLTASLDTTIAQLRFVAARQLYPLAGPRLKKELEQKAGRAVSEAEVTRVLASMLLFHSHPAVTAPRSRGLRWLPGLRDDGLDLDPNEPASSTTLRALASSFKVNSLVENGMTHEDFVWSKLVIFMRGKLHPFVEAGIKMAYMDAPGVKEEEESVRARLSRPLQLEQCLSKFSEPEILDERNYWFCPKCKAHVAARKTLQAWSLPEVVFVHLNRFAKQEGGRYPSTFKAEELVEFPLVGLDLSRFQLEPAKDGVGLTYDCIAVVNHHGGMGGGHYTAYTNHEVSQWGGVGAPQLSGGAGKWNLFDDTRVAPVDDPTDVVTRAAYVLVYQRRTFQLAPRQERIAAAAAATVAAARAT